MKARIAERLTALHIIEETMLMEITFERNSALIAPYGQAVCDDVAEVIIEYIS